MNIATFRTTNSGGPWETHIRFPGTNIAQIGEVIHAFQMGFFLGTGRKLALIGMHASVRDTTACIDYDDRAALTHLKELIS